MVAAANRRLERLIERYRADGRDERARSAATLRLAMYELREQVDRLARATEPGAATAIRARVEAALERSGRELDALLAEPPAPSPRARSG